jgi:hypothetical protein
MPIFQAQLCIQIIIKNLFTIPSACLPLKGSYIVEVIDKLLPYSAEVSKRRGKTVLLDIFLLTSTISYA